MSTERVTVSLPEDLRRAAAGVADERGVSFSAQVWRDGARQARLARSLPMIDVRPTGLREAREAGELLTVSGTADVVDALVVLAAMPGDQLLTSDPGDLSSLVGQLDRPATVVGV